MRISSAMLVLATLLSAGGSASIPLTYNFSRGIPAGATLVDADSLPLNLDHYRNIDAQSAPWIVKNFGNAKVALSPTSTGKGGEGECQSNWLIMEPVALTTPTPTVRWRSRSCCDALPESYRIVCREEGTADWTTVFTCEAESPRWTWHAASLASFADKTVEVAIECTSRDCFMLALQEISVCPDESVLEINNLSAHYQPSGEAVIAGAVCSYPQIATPVEVTLTIGEESYTVTTTGDFSFNLPLSEGQVIDYTLTTGSATVSDFVSCSPFPRLAIVDHLCSTWCNNCPRFSLTTDPLLKQMGSDMFMVETHVYSAASDPWIFKDYAEAFSYVYSIPCLVANRNADTYFGSASQNVKLVQTELRRPATWGLSVSGSQVSTGTLALSAQLSSPADYTQEDGRYGLLVSQLCDFQGDDPYRFLQDNNATIAAHEQWCYMPELITGRMLLLRNLPVSCKTLPVESTKVDFTLDLLTPDDSFHPQVMVLLIDNTNGQVLNGAVVDAANPTAALHPLNTQAQQGPTAYFDLAGRRVAKPSKGQLVIKRQGNKTEKIIIQ